MSQGHCVCANTPNTQPQRLLPARRHGSRAPGILPAPVLALHSFPCQGTQARTQWPREGPPAQHSDFSTPWSDQGRGPEEGSSRLEQFLFSARSPEHRDTWAALKPLRTPSTPDLGQRRGAARESGATEGSQAKFHPLQEEHGKQRRPGRSGEVYVPVAHA